MKTSSQDHFLVKEIRRLKSQLKTIYNFAKGKKYLTINRFCVFFVSSARIQKYNIQFKVLCLYTELQCRASGRRFHQFYQLKCFLTFSSGVFAMLHEICTWSVYKNHYNVYAGVITNVKSI